MIEKLIIMLISTAIFLTSFFGLLFKSIPYVESLTNKIKNQPQSDFVKMVKISVIYFVQSMALSSISIILFIATIIGLRELIL